MTANTAPQRITARLFSRTFEKMCNFMAVSRTGDSAGTIRGLVTLCLYEFPDERLDSAEQFREAIETLFGLIVPREQVESALANLSEEGIISQPGNTNHRLAPAAMATLQKAIGNAHALEDRVKTVWLGELANTQPELPGDVAWDVLRSYLQRSFRRHGMQAAALLDPTIDTPVEYDASLTSILRDVIASHVRLSDGLRQKAESAISDFMASLGSDAERSRYIAQIADGAFSFYTLEIPPDLSEQLRENLHELTLFLDTNFLFGILDLHYNAQVQVSHDLLRVIRTHKLPFKLRYHHATQKEMAGTIVFYGSILRSRTWARSLSRAAAACRNLSGIEQKFHEANSVGAIDVNEFLRPYEHLDEVLKGRDITVYRGHEDRLQARNDLFHEYRQFLEKHKRGDKSYETVMHDAAVLDEARRLRTNAASSLEAGALIVSCDYYLYRFDWESSRRNGHRPCVLLPTMLWQILRPFIPSDQDFEKAFAETFALPEFRTISSGGSKACSKMLQILASYRDVPEQTAMKLLSNDLLLDRLRAEHDDVKFAEQVEAAFVEENRNLLEERAALQQELIRQKARAEEESRKREEERAAFEAVQQQYHETLESEAKAKSEAARRAELAEQSASDAQGMVAQADEAKNVAEKKALRVSMVAGFTLGGFAVVLFLFLANMLPWTWLITHKNSLPLQIGIAATLLCASTGAFVRPWRGWSWGVGVFGLIITLLCLMGT